jgi:hypothetical protein
MHGFEAKIQLALKVVAYLKISVAGFVAIGLGFCQ